MAEPNEVEQRLAELSLSNGDESVNEINENTSNEKNQKGDCHKASNDGDMHIPIEKSHCIESKRVETDKKVAWDLNTDNINKSTKLLLQGEKYIESCNYQDAKHCYTEAIKLSPDSDDLYTKLAIISYELGQFEEALHYCDLATTLNETNTDSLIQKGKVLISLGKHNEALILYRKVITLDPTKKSVMEKYISEAESTAFVTSEGAKASTSAFVEDKDSSKKQANIESPHRSSESDKLYKCGAVIMSCQPYVFNVCDEYQNTNCGACLHQSFDLKRCAACRVTRYCSKTCQKTAWKFHKLECRFLKSFAPKVPPLPAIILFKLLVMYSQDINVTKRNDNKRCFNDLQSNVCYLKEIPAKMISYTVLIKMMRQHASEIISIPDDETIIEILGKWETNAFAIDDGFSNQIAHGLFLESSIFDHSCDPNTIRTFHGTTMEVMALRDIQGLHNARVTYIDLMQSFQQRQEELKSKFYFTCTCERCSMKDELEHLIYCQSESCNGPVPVSTGICSSCLFKCSVDKAAIEKLRESILTLAKANRKCIYSDGIDSFSRQFISKMITDEARSILCSKDYVLHHLDVYNAQLVYILYSEGLDVLDGVDLEFVEEYKLDEIFIKYYGKYHTRHGQLMLNIGSRFMKKLDCRNARKYFSKGLKVYEVISPKCQLVKQVSSSIADCSRFLANRTLAGSFFPGGNFL